MRRKASASRREARDEEAARDRCLRLLGLRARSSEELRERLTRAGFANEVIEVVLSGLERAGLVNDEEFARSWVASRQASGESGRRKLRWELRRKGICEDLIRRVVDQEIDDETEMRQAMALAQRRLKGQPVEPKALPRLRRLLLRRGFGFDAVDSVLQSIVGEAEQ